jgi:biopolymer transport protein ExbD
MAASNNQGDDDGMVSGINVTPLVDVCLVLLIIFMVTAKWIQAQSMPLDLPKAATGTDIQMVFGLELHENGDVVVNGKKLAKIEDILPMAKEELQRTPDLRAVIRADKTVQHGRVIQALDLLKQGGVSKIAFGVSPIATEPGAVAGGTAAPAAPPPAPAPATSK